MRRRSNHHGQEDHRPSEYDVQKEGNLTKKMEEKEPETTEVFVKVETGPPKPERPAVVIVAEPDATEVVEGGIVSNESIIRDYLAGKRSPRTRKIYRDSVLEFLAICGGKPIAEIGRSELADYAESARKALEAGAAKATIRLRIQSVRTFLSWAFEEGLFPITPSRVGRAIERPRADGQKQFPILTVQQAADMRRAALRPRDSALMAIMLGGGLRVAETEALNVESLRKRPNGRLRLDVDGKGRKKRQVPLPADASDAVLDYLTDSGRTLSTRGPLFIGIDRGREGSPRLGMRSIVRIIKDMAERAGITGERISPHALRHSAAVHWLRSGLQITEVARLLGHTSITTTQVYVDHLNGEDLEDRMPSMLGAVDGDGGRINSKHTQGGTTSE